MMEFLYQSLARIGYTHPIHPPLTHVPVGMVMGAFLFGLGAWALRRSNLAITSRYCAILALLGVFPTVLLGYLDWQHYYAGAWIFPIKMKLGLAAFLLILLLLAVSRRPKRDRVSTGILLIYFLCLLTVAALGYYGGELVFGTSKGVIADEAPDNGVDAAQFTTHCASCHPKGGNIFKANLPLHNAPQLADFKKFLRYLRQPRARDGSTTLMPPFSASKLSEKEAKEIYDYTVRALNKR
ncbi:MAG: c-type cytochrome [Deltaproteobacteria bacterium]|nr:c-type cytochrome [Deltaproteobacteria bacterium]MBW2071745.1 c-type cytochrome [Deltaproteobacteria bacterium]